MDSSSSKPPLVIALDGPAASGKGTLGRLIADAYGFAYLDTGVLYRGVAWLMLNEGADPKNQETAEAYARAFNLDRIEGADIRTKDVGAAASIVAANAGVRAALLDFQRDFAANPPARGTAPKDAYEEGRMKGGVRGAVLDGRDIGTVVCPWAQIKFFVVASPKVRAHRRFLELKNKRKGEDSGFTEAEVFNDLVERDARDAARDDAPMKAADDAELLDTTHLTIEAAFAAARRVIDGVFLAYENS